jgi:hypothetical protein
MGRVFHSNNILWPETPLLSSCLQLGKLPLRHSSSLPPNDVIRVYLLVLCVSSLRFFYFWYFSLIAQLPLVFK